MPDATTPLQTGGHEMPPPFPVIFAPADDPATATLSITPLDQLRPDDLAPPDLAEVMG